MKFKVLNILILLIPLSLQAADSQSLNKLIRLATTTSVANSGLLDYLLPFFLKQHSYDIKITTVGSGKALRMGRTGDVDIVWVHSPQAEQKFVNEGYGLRHQRVMLNDFVLVGPENDLDKISSARNVLDAFRLIAKGQHLFVSRGDDSGTHKKELSLWKQADITPYGSDWYLEIGADMLTSLKIAQQKNAFTIIDRATFVVRHGKKFKILVEDPVNLSNPYSVIAVNPAKNTGINLEGASSLIDWLISPAGQQAIAQFNHNGQQLYQPLKLPIEKET